MKLFYNNYEGTMSYDLTDFKFYGMIEHIKEWVMYEGDDGAELYKNFKQAVREYEQTKV